jgi:hypothetical protein
VDWARAEGLLGLALPDDYKALAEAYGVGWFSEWLMVNLPDSPCPQFDLLQDVQDSVEWHRHSRDQQPGTILYAFHPEPSGLIRWGHTRTGDDFWWLPVTDSPRAWRIVASDHCVDWADFDCTTTEFVYRLLTEQLILSVSDRTPQILPWADRRPHHRPEFRPMPVLPDSDWNPQADGSAPAASPGRHPRRHGDACCWYPAGRDPATWPVVLCSASGAGWQRYDLTSTAFLCEWLAGGVRPAYHTPPHAPLRARLHRLAELLGVGQGESKVDWPAAEAELGVRLPADYRAFVERFGAGSINQELYVDTPFAPSAHFDLIAAHAEWADALRQLHQEFPEYEPYPPYPPPGGLLLWGKTNTRVSLSWHTDGPDPDAWPVVLFDDVDWVDCGRGFLDILLDHLTGRNPLQGLIGFSPAWPPRWQPMRRREMLSPTTGP